MYDNNTLSTSLSKSSLSSNVMVEWLTLQLHILEVPGSNLGPETGYPD
jgi:hypothetical protein